MVCNNFDYYWRLQRYGGIRKGDISRQLKQLGYTRIKGHTTKSTLVKILWRRERGLLCYDVCSDDELLKFAVDKGLTTILHPDAQLRCKDRVTLIQTLEGQDEELSFGKFLDMPAELRARVYEWCIAAFSTTLRFPTTPPLSRACRLFRQEALPLFYANIEFELYLRQYRVEDGSGSFRLEFSETDTTQSFLARLNQVDVANIRKLKLVIQRYNMDWGAHEREVVCRVDLGSNEGASEVVMEEREWDRHPRWILWWGTEARVELETSLRRLLSGLKMIDGRRKLTLEDIQEFRDVVQAAAYLIAN